MDYINLYQRQALGETYRTGITATIFQLDRIPEQRLVNNAKGAKNSNENK